VLLASAIAVVAVALGLALGLAPIGRTRIAGPLRTFALSAALTVVVLHLLPEAFSELGALALALFAATVVVPPWLRLGRGLGGTHHGDGDVHRGLVAGYIGLLIHHVGDGLGLGAYAGLPGGAGRHADVMLALAAHTVPLVAVVAFAFQRAAGSRSALRAAAGLAGASVLGVVLSNLVPEALVERSTAWVAALVAGLLVHVVTHDLGRDLPANVPARALDALAAAAGVATSLLGGEHSAGNHPAAFVAVAEQVVGSLSLPLLAGIVLATLLTLGKQGTFRRALEAAFGPSLAVDGVVLAFWIGGVGWGVVYAAGALVVARAIAAAAPATAVLSSEPSGESRPFLIRLDDRTTELLPWIGAALVLSTLLASSFPQRALEVLSPAVALGVAVVVALPVRVPPAAALVLAAALERAGLPVGAALVFALLAPAPGAAELLAVAGKARPGAARRLAISAAAAALSLGIAASFATTLFDADAMPPLREMTSRFAFLLLAVLGARAAFEQGVRGLLLHVFPSHDTAAHAEAAAGDARLSSPEGSVASEG
jgi:hypothetical protein